MVEDRLEGLLSLYARELLRVVGLRFPQIALGLPRGAWIQPRQLVRAQKKRETANQEGVQTRVMRFTLKRSRQMRL